MYDIEYLQAFHKQLIFPQYVLILRSWYPAGWWDPANELNYVLNCTKIQMETALYGALSVSLDTFYNENISLSGLVSLTLTIKPLFFMTTHEVLCGFIVTDFFPILEKVQSA